MTPNELVSGAVADCLEKYLEEFGIDLYRYPSGEMKGIEYKRRPGYGEIDIIPHGTKSGRFSVIVLTAIEPTDE